MKKISVLIAFLIISLSSCRKKTSALALEKKVLLEILPAIVDSTAKDPRIFLAPPPYPLFPPTENALTEKDKAKRITLYEIKRATVERDTLPIYLAINPEIKNLNEKFEESHFMINAFEEYLKGKKILHNNQKSYVLDLSQIKLNGKFRFVHDSLFIHNDKVWTKKYDFIFAGFFHLSRIRFDESKTLGVLYASYSCGSRCGYGHLVFIKKVNNRWLIDKLQMTWIS